MNGRHGTERRLCSGMERNNEFHWERAGYDRRVLLVEPVLGG